MLGWIFFIFLGLAFLGVVSTLGVVGTIVSVIIAVCLIVVVVFPK